MPVIGLTGAVMFILGSIGDSKSYKNKKGWKKWD